MAASQPVHASGVINVHLYEPEDLDTSDGGMDVVKIRVEETFSGDLEGEGVATFLQAARIDGSASFVGVERVTGTLGAKQGTFLLQDAGIVENEVVSGDWFVVPGSGTGELTGLRGTGGFRAKLGESAQIHLDYWFE